MVSNRWTPSSAQVGHGDPVDTTSGTLDHDNANDYPSNDGSLTGSFRKLKPGMDTLKPRWLPSDKNLQPRTSSGRHADPLPDAELGLLSARFSPAHLQLIAAAGGDAVFDPSEMYPVVSIATPAGSGVFLTWKDLCVSVGSNVLLNSLTGYAEPGQVLAIMGPSGSGKTTLLDTLAGRLANNMKQTGEILVNGTKQSLSYGNSAYVTQDDVLMATLTVKEAIYYSARLQLPDSMTIQEKLERANQSIRDMGLQDARNNQIGGWRSKGLSGGEKRRVSIAMQILTHPRLLFLDEPTSGLDSAAAYHVVKRLKKLASGGRTVIASVHQPSTDVFELFTSLYLLSNGRTIYFGAIAGATEFFAVNNFPCAPLRNPSDHYLRTINADFERDVEGGDTHAKKQTTEEVISILSNAYKNSDMAMAVSEKVKQAPTMLQGLPSLVANSGRANFATQVHVLTIRSFKNMYRDLGYYWLRLAINIALCLCVGTIYYKVGLVYNSIQARASMLLFVATFLTFMAIGGFPSFVEDMKVFRAERLNGQYGVASFVVANTLSSLPFLLLISIVPGALAYFLVDLHPGFDHFLYFILTLSSCLILVESLMMMVASFVPDFLLGIITGSGIQGVFMLNSGFFRLPSDLPKVVWTYPVSYIAFHSFANQGFYKNDFEGLTFQSNVVGAPPITGEYVLRDMYQVTLSYSKWVDLGILVGMSIVYRILFFSLIKIKEKLGPRIKSYFL